MALDFKESANVLRKEAKVYSIYVLSIVIMLVIFVYTGSKIYQNISKIQKDSQDITSDINTLERKIDSLHSIKDDAFTDIKTLAVSFPEEDPTLFTYSQLKEIASKTNVAISSLIFSRSNEVKTDISSSGISLVLTGNKTSILEFISILSKSAPISGISDIGVKNLSVNDETFSMGLTIDLYFSPLPKTLPDRTNIVNVLSSEEKEIFNELKNFEIHNNYVVEASYENDPNTINPFVSLSTETPPEVSVGE